MTNPEKTTLQGNEAIELWKKGKNAWNEWGEDNPVTDVSFAGVDFSKHIVTGMISFAGYRFRTGSVDFSETTFGKGNVNFSGATFGEGDVNFSGANFGESDVKFIGVNFGKGNVYFYKATFGDVDFSQVNFGKGNVYFSGATFGEGNVDFRNATFGEGNVDFRNTTFGEGGVDFENVVFLGNVDSSYLRHCDKVTRFSFRNVSFNKTFTISGDFGCVVDMVGTKTSHHVELSGLICRLQRTGFPEKADDEDDAARLRRLKELAERNKHHEAALKFHADEMRAKRWRETGFFASCLDMLFSAVSNYGQSIWRPVLGLIALAALSYFSPEILPLIRKIVVYFGIDKDALKTAIQNSLPFLPASRSTSSLFSTLHQLAAFIFIFLIGLGLRNRFRV